jgi:hypothetical protein
MTTPSRPTRPSNWAVVAQSAATALLAYVIAGAAENTLIPWLQINEQELAREDDRTVVVLAVRDDVTDPGAR